VETGYRDRRIGESVAVLSEGELDGGRRATMWVSPQIKKSNEINDVGL
jgi:hypothetical protein